MSSLSIGAKLPFQAEIIDEGVDLYADIESSALYRMLPANAKEYVMKSPHLLEYLHIFPVNTYGIPLFLSELKKELRTMQSPNIIYPVSDTTFVHILADPNDVRAYYIPIEPSFLHSVSEIMPVIEHKLIDLIDALDYDPVTDKERAEVITKMLTKVAVINSKISESEIFNEDNTKKQDFKTKLTEFLNKDLTAKDGKIPRLASGVKIQKTLDGRIILSEPEYRALEYLLIRDKIDMGVLKPFLSDSNIEDISCDGVGPIFVEHKIFKGLKSVIEFKESTELDKFVIKMAERIKNQLLTAARSSMQHFPMVPVSILCMERIFPDTAAISPSVKSTKFP